MFRDGNFDRWDVDQAVVRGMENAEPGGLRNPQTSSHTSGMDPGPHNGVGPGGVGKILSINASSIVLRLSLLRHRHAVP